MPSIQHVDRGRGLFYKHRTSAVPLTWSCCLQVTSSCLLLSYVQQGHSLLCMLLVKSCSWRKSCLLAGGRMQKNFHIGKFFERARRRSLRLDITTRAIGVERSFLLWAPASTYNNFTTCTYFSIKIFNTMFKCTYFDSRLKLCLVSVYMVKLWFNWH